MIKEELKHYLRGNGLAYMAVEALYENALYVPFVLRQRLSSVVLALRTGVFSSRPGQSVMTWDVPFPHCDRPGDLVAWLRLQGVDVSEGGHTFYIAPQAALRRIIGSIVDFYPPQAGFKILKDLRDPKRARYIYKHPRSPRMLKRLIGSPRDQLVAANYMYALGIGPRVWDMCCWSAPGRRCTVFVVDHVTGRQPSIEQCATFLARLQHLNAQSHLRILVPRWRQSMDFQPPDCNRNLVHSDALGRVQYVDFQNFGLADGGAGWRRMMVPATRSKRRSSISAALRHAAIDVGRRLVLDVGCGDGTNLHAALAAGAAWGVGWDGPEMVRRASRRLFSHGCARFSLISADLQRHHHLQDDVPSRLRWLMARAVVFCPAGRSDLSPLQSVFAMPWNVLVCEGDASDSYDEVACRVQSLAGASGRDCVEVVASARVAAAGTLRPLIIVRRQHAGEWIRARWEQAG